MKPYVFNYSESVNLQKPSTVYNAEAQMHLNPDGTQPLLKAGGNTIRTESVEPSDPDEFLLASSTIVTNVVEGGDDDSFFGGVTVITRTFEDSDPDDLVCSDCEESGLGGDSTLMTKSLEPADDDYFPQ